MVYFLNFMGIVSVVVAIVEIIDRFEVPLGVRFPSTTAAFRWIEKYGLIDKEFISRYDPKILIDVFCFSQIFRDFLLTRLRPIRTSW